MHTQCPPVDYDGTKSLQNETHSLKSQSLLVCKINNF